MGAPVCNINPKNPIPASKAPGLPSIPIATDLPSLIAAVNALRQLLLQLLGQIPASSNTITVKPSNFIEAPNSRVTVQNTIYDPNDPTNETYVTVNQITHLEFIDPISGQTIVWSQSS